MDKYQRDVTAVTATLIRSSNGLLLVECAIKAGLKPSEAQYVLDCLIEEGSVIMELKGRLQIPIYSSGEK